jgi:hypothetical protein
VLDVLADASDGFDGHRRIFETGEEFEVSMVRRDGKLSQVVPCRIAPRTIRTL